MKTLKIQLYSILLSHVTAARGCAIDQRDYNTNDTVHVHTVGP